MDRSTPTTHDWIDQPEGRLRVTRAGDTGPPVLLLSGAGSDNAELSWSRLLPALATDHRVYALDWPKQGGSRPWAGLADHDRLLACVETVLDHYQFDRVDLVGLSLGGAMSLATTLAFPDRVRRLVAMAPAGILPPFLPVVHQLLWLTGRSRLLNRTLPSLMFRDRRATAAFVRATLIPEPVDDFDEVVDQVMAEVAGGVGSSDWQNESINFTSMNIDLRPELHRIGCPTLFIQGAKDVGIPARHTIAAAAAVPGARLELLAGAGHWVQRNEPERVNRLIADFLAD